MVNVSDFAGHFEAKGVPELEGGGANDLAKRLKALKPPKRPRPPAKPKLEETGRVVVRGGEGGRVGGG